MSSFRLAQFRCSGSVFNRFVRYCICMIGLPTMLLLLIVILYYRYENVNTEKEYAQEYLSEMCSEIAWNMDSMQGSARSLMADSTLQRLINQSTISQKDLLALKRQTVPNIQNILSANSDLYAIRFFYAREDLAEVSSCFYPIGCLPEETLRAAGRSPYWRIGFQDSAGENQGTEQLVFLYMPTYTFDGVFSGLIEVSMQMDKFMSNMSIVQSGMLTGYMTDTNIMYYSYDEREYAFGEREWSYYLRDMYAYFTRSGDSFTGALGDSGHTVYGCTKNVDTIDGKIFCVIDISETVSRSNQYLVLCLSCFVLFILFAVLLTRLYTGRLLRRLYLLIYGMQQVESGNLDISMDPGKTDDEFAELARLFNQMTEALKVLNRANAQKQELATRSEVRALQNQINAHFLYNTLETIRMMAYIDGNGQVAQAIAQLGSIFRYGMHSSDATVTIGDEVENIKTYLQLMELQLDYKVTLHVDIEPIYMRQEISRLSLQPVVENAILHGLNPVGRDGQIFVRCLADEDGSAFRIMITDYGVGIEEETLVLLRDNLSDAHDELSMSIGLQNVNNRIKLRFGAEYGVIVESVRQKYTQISLRLPLNR